MLGGKWLPVRPTTDSALSVRSCMSGSRRDCTTRISSPVALPASTEWKAYILGEEDGVAKTRNGRRTTEFPPRMSSRWPGCRGAKKTYLPGGSAPALVAPVAATGQQWARNMIMLMTMQGWGKPGVNFGNLQCGTPIDLLPYFPGYAEGGISGDI